MDSWELPCPHVHAVVAGPGDMDGYGHVNNAVYVRWLDEAAWSHSTALGIGPAACSAIRTGMVVMRTQVHYRAPAYAGDHIEIGTWIIGNDGRLRVSRRFQLRRVGDGRTLVVALIHYVCADLDSGRPRKMPPDFVASYRPLDAVRRAVEAGPVSWEPGVEPGPRGSAAG